MLTAQFTTEDGFSTVQIDAAPLKQGEVRIRVEACGVCGSDRQVVKGEAVPAGTSFPLTMGHEISGTIVEIEEQVGDFQEGDHVAVHPFIFCGTCAACQNNQPNLCIRQAVIGYHRPGGFAEQVIVPQSQLIKLPDHFSSAAAAVLVDAYATPFHAMNLSRVQAGHTVIVIGTGGIGLASLQLADIFSVGHLGAVTRRASGVKIAEEYGSEAGFTIMDDARRTARTIRRWSKSGGIDVVIDTIASRETVALALDIVRPGGKVTIIGMSDDTVSIPIAKTVRRGIQVITSYGSVIEDVGKLVELTAAGKLDPTKLIAGTIALENINQAFQDVRMSGRWVIEPNRK
ncbi:propanol-preferring alcohol dehydrogenase [Scopulibacillus darangshiensis]|uniref:Propanol-preferring alcohol dehydrogenase n=1 Tax=Scopulibacillus darangshiensis TaxID=442528 RepID=A0A4R2P218_9BACL|nr:alcohol dehydrogenase catalytic domain-containing protein [Scopulibacillus darangshiensis]TCP28759.1 propanol-preferring alcohol dehydrogenase [Scopulibacillus darangshiensis]